LQYLSLFFASIDLRRAALLIFAWLAAPLASRTRRRGTLAAAVREQLGEVRVFSFGSGRGALAACLRAAGVGEGDTVLLSSYTCLAVPAAVLAAGARPEYVDIDAGSLCTPAETLIAALHPRVRAVVVQHTLGRSAPLGALAAVTRERGITLIEDCALSLGSTHAGRPHGIAGDAAIFSMELSKTLSTGWGGVLAVSNPALADRAEEQYAQVPTPGVGRGLGCRLEDRRERPHRGAVDAVAHEDIAGDQHVLRVADDADVARVGRVGQHLPMEVRFDDALALRR